MERVLKINMTDTNNEALSKTIPNVNPNATDADLLDFSDGYVGLTTNTHVSTEKIDTTVLVRS